MAENINYFYIENAFEGENKLAISNTVKHNLEYSVDGNIWNTYNFTSQPKMANLGDRIYLRGTNNTFSQGTATKGTINCVNKFKIGGDITTLLDPKGNVLDLTGRDNTFARVFKECQTKLVDISNLVLPSTTLAYESYIYMFFDCRAITTMPELPATTLADHCYQGMFQQCESLKNVKPLIAKKLGKLSYQSMFEGCKSLINPPKLNAEILDVSCCSKMFKSCISLINTPILKAKTLVQNCYIEMFNGCSNLDNVYYLGMTPLKDTLYTNSWLNNTKKDGYVMFYKNPDLLESDLQTNISGTNGRIVSDYFIKDFYIENAFDGDNQLILNKNFNFEYNLIDPNDESSWILYDFNSPIVLHNLGERIYLRGENVNFKTDSDINKIDCQNPFNICGDLTMLLNKVGMIQDLQAYPWAFYSLFYQSKLKDASKLILVSKKLSDSCYRSLFNECKILEKAPKIEALELAPYCCAYMFRFCEKLETPPELYASDLADFCYFHMFYTCRALKRTPKLIIRTLAFHCCERMFNLCTNLKSAFSFFNIPAGKDSCHHMYDQCKNIEIAPTFYGNIYNGMCHWIFINCSKLRYVKFIGTNIDRHSIYDFTTGTAAKGTFVKHPKSQINNGSGGVPNGWARVEYYKGFYIENLYHGFNQLNIKNNNFNLEYSETPELEDTWKPLDFNNQPTFFNAIYLRGTNNTFTQNEENVSTIDCLYDFGIGGDITTLLDPNGNVTDLTGRDNCFKNLFYNVKHLIKNFDLKTPSTILSPYCYYQMFSLSNIDKTSELPALTLTDYCYYKMFAGCEELIESCELPATTLAILCYFAMFINCKKLVKTVTILPAMKVLGSCYKDMYGGCISLTDAPELPATEISNNCYESMFARCSSLINPPTILPALKLYTNCYFCMFEFCVNLPKAPILPAYEMANNCYQRMFASCFKLERAPELPAGKLANLCYYQMFHRAGLKYPPSVLPASHLKARCYQEMFEECRQLTETPIIKGETFETWACGLMFRNCLKLIKITINSKNWFAGASSRWVGGITTKGVAILNKEIVP